MQTPLFDSGPQARADLAACRDMLREGSRTFLAASFVLPAAVSEPACALYAFCRMADDEFDLNDGGSDALAALSDRLDRIYARRPSPIATDRAFAEVVWRFGIPRAIPDALLEGFAWDAAGRRYETLSDLKAYAVRVAGTVGAMMALLMGQRSRDAVARACELGIAMQLTNIARDVGEDARAGRLYLPLEWLRESGIDRDAFVARPVYSDALGSVVQRLLEAADVHYASCESGIAGLPRACRPGIMAARALYAEIGREVERAGCEFGFQACRGDGVAQGSAPCKNHRECDDIGSRRRIRGDPRGGVSCRGGRAHRAPAYSAIRTAMVEFQQPFGPAHRIVRAA